MFYGIKLFHVILALEIIKVFGMDYCTYSARDCKELQEMGFTESGVYHVTPAGTNERHEVYCDMDTDGGGWLVFQRRGNGTENFAREWNDYELGFGNATEEFWLGNILLHIMTSKFFYHLRIDLEDWDGNTAYAKYQRFKIADLNDKYRLDIGGYSGDAGDSLKYHNGQRFVTSDDDFNGCAKDYLAGWWFRHCFESNLNGDYRPDGGTFEEKDKYRRIGIQWHSWKGMYYSLKTIEMKIK